MRKWTQGGDAVRFRMSTFGERFRSGLRSLSYGPRMRTRLSATFIYFNTNSRSKGLAGASRAFGWVLMKIRSNAKTTKEQTVVLVHRLSAFKSQGYELETRKRLRPFGGLLWL